MSNKTSHTKFQDLRNRAERLLERHGNSVDHEVQAVITDLLDECSNAVEQNALQGEDAISAPDAKPGHVPQNARRRGGGEERLWQSRERLRSLADQLTTMEEAQRRKIAVNLHDTVAQTLAIANMRLGYLLKSLQQDDQVEELEEIRELVQSSVNATLELIEEISPPILAEQDFETAISWVAQQFEERYQMEISVVTDAGDIVLKDRKKRFLFHALRELLTNITRHAGTNHATVSLSRDNDKICLHVSDDGVGFTPAGITDSNGLGLFHIEERSETLGGDFRLDSKPGAGTDVSVLVPI